MSTSKYDVSEHQQGTANVTAALQEQPQPQPQRHQRRPAGDAAGKTREQVAVVVGAGTAARTLAQCAIHPIETLKTRLMLRCALLRGAHTAGAVAGAAARLVTGSRAPSGRALPALAGAGRRAGGLAVASAGRLTLRPALGLQQGRDVLHGLHAGLGGALLAAVPTGLFYFLTYELCSHQLQLYFDQRPVNGNGNGSTGAAPRGPPSAAGTVHMIAAATAAAVSSVARVPADLVRHRVQAGMDPNLWAAARGAWQRGGGPRGLYAGFTATLVRDIPEIWLSFTLFELGRVEVGRGGWPSGGGGRRRGGGSAPPLQLQPWQHLILGGGCGALAAAVTVPLDNIKARVQCGLVSGVGGAAAATGLAGLHQAAANILRESGPGGLLAGLVPRVVQVGGQGGGVDAAQVQSHRQAVSSPTQV
jgi:solute carrier family 25 S-adenosylmethionine transporter 26